MIKKKENIYNCTLKNFVYLNLFILQIESYWTYELCHGKHVRQYHENKEMGLVSNITMFNPCPVEYFYVLHSSLIFILITAFQLPWWDIGIQISIDSLSVHFSAIYII